MTEKKFIFLAEKNLHPKITRRFLLRAGAVGLCACFLPWPALAAKADYYTRDRAPFLANFNKLCDAAKPWIAARKNEALAETITADAKRRFATLLLGLPDIGGRQNRNQSFLTMAGWLTSLTLAMGEKGMPAQDAGRLLYDLGEAEWKAIPRDKALAMGDLFFSPAYELGLKKWAEQSQKRHHPYDWVARFVPGDGKTFDVGYDYTACGAVAYFKAQGVAAVAPYFCLNDFIASKAQGTGLFRTQTIAQGDPICNFRYKHDRPVTQNWDTEVPHFSHA